MRLQSVLNCQEEAASIAGELNVIWKSWREPRCWVEKTLSLISSIVHYCWADLVYGGLKRRKESLTIVVTQIGTFEANFKQK